MIATPRGESSEATSVLGGDFEEALKSIYESICKSRAD